MGDRNYTNVRQVASWETEEGMVLWTPPSEFFRLGSLPARVDPFGISATQQFPLGSTLRYADRLFRYTWMGATAGAAGAVYQSVVPLAGHIDEVAATGTAGTFVINFTPNTLTTDDLAADELADGYIHLNSGTGKAYMYRIRSHPAILGAASGVLTLYDDIKVTIAATPKATVLHNPWRKVIITPSSGPTAPIVGVCTSVVTANNYCWLQVAGPCAVLTNGTVQVGAGVMPSDAVAGAVEHFVPETDTIGEVEAMGPIGRVMAVNADTEYSAVWLSIE